MGVQSVPMFSQVFKSDFPVWDFLNQHVFDSEAQFLSPAEFQKQHRIARLESCLTLTCQDRDKQHPFS
jgi:hypothetical protein